MLLKHLRNFTTNHKPFVRRKSHFSCRCRCKPDSSDSNNNNFNPYKEKRLKFNFGKAKHWHRQRWSSSWTDLFTFLILILFVYETIFVTMVECDRYNKVTTSATVPPDINKPGIVKRTFEGNESSWVPGLSAAVIVIIVFLISIFACCIHCPFCLVYRRNDPQRVV